MATRSKIEWTHTTWNPLTGCTKISPGCMHCYAERMALRLQAMGQAKYTNGFGLTLHENLLEAPLAWKKPRAVFVNSMSDLLHKDVPLDFIRSVFDVVRRTPRHRYSILTKRADRLAEINEELDWPDNLWMGVTVENRDYMWRIDRLRETGAKTRFLSVEPLLGPLPDLDLAGIHWVAVGGESGPGARPMSAEWAVEVKDQCIAAGVAFFFKQWGGVDKKKTGRMLEGRLWEEMPEYQPPSEKAAELTLPFAEALR